MSIRVLLVDDHRVLREGLCAILDQADDVEVVGEAGNGREAIELAGKLMPEVVVMDVAMPELNGMGATRQLVKSGEGGRIIALSSYADKRYVLAMFEAGASGYVLKDAAADEVLAAVRAVHQGKKYLSVGVTSVVLDRFFGPQAKTGAQSSEDDRLSPREREILQLLAEGHTSAEIGHRLSLASATVETHRRNIMKKLDIHSVAALTKYALREGLTSP